MSFGNSTSTVRQFKRVSSGQKQTSPTQITSAATAEDSAFDSDAENRPPPPQQRPQPVVAATKEAVLGRRAYAKSLDAAFQEAHAATGDRQKREALSQVAEAWSKLDEVDPEGELLLLKGIMDRIQADPKLASALLPQRVANAQLASLRVNSPTKKNTISIAESELGSRDMTPQSSPSKAVHKPRGSVDVPSSPSKGQNQSPGRLVLNPQNPHLKKMRSNQQFNAEKEKALSSLDEKMPGKAEPGMEHVSLLGDVLYGRWTEGLKARWPLA